jgi:hypothetical protein
MDLANNQGRNKNCTQEYVVNVAWNLLQPSATWTRPGQGKRTQRSKLALLWQVRGRQQESLD